MDATTDAKLEYQADRMIRDTRAHEGDYPAYSERDLRTKVKSRREITEADLIWDAGQIDYDGDAKYLNSPLETGEHLYDSHNPIDAKFRIKPGYDLVLLLFAEGSGLTSRQRTLVKLTLAGLSLRRIERLFSIPKSTAGRELKAATAMMKQQREALEPDYDLDPTAIVPRLLRSGLPVPGSEWNLRAWLAEGAKGVTVRRVVAGTAKPVAISTRKRPQPHINFINRLGPGLPGSESAHKRSHRCMETRSPRK